MLSLLWKDIHEYLLPACCMIDAHEYADKEKENMTRSITEESLAIYRERLLYDEKCTNTIHKYMRDVRKLMNYAAGRPLDKELLIEYKEYLEQCGKYKVTSINSFLAAANHYCEVMGWTELRVKMLKVQQAAFLPENRELSEREYQRLIRTALERREERLALILQTIGSTGIRISELQYITVESLKSGCADIYNKGKARRILYPSELVRLLLQYVKKQKLTSGIIFCTRTGKPLDRSYIWKSMKKLCEAAHVAKEKVYPHNLRHLFARAFYHLQRDIAKLADILGHCNIETTRIYIKSTGKEHRRQLDRMHMIVRNTEQKKRAGISLAT